MAATPNGPPPKVGAPSSLVSELGCAEGENPGKGAGLPAGENPGKGAGLTGGENPGKATEDTGELLTGKLVLRVKSDSAKVTATSEGMLGDLAIPMHCESIGDSEMLDVTGMLGDSG